MAHSGYDVMANFADAQSTEPFGALFDNDFQPMLLIDPETTAIVDANSAACAFYGYSRAEFVRLKKTNINVAPESEIRDLVKNAVVGHHTRSQLQHRLANGDIRDVEDWIGIVAVGRRQLLCSIVRDVTDQRRTEAALRASQVMLATAERIAQVGSWDWDIAGNTLVWSEEQCRLFGYAPEDFNEKYEGWMVCIHPDDRKRVQEAIDAAVAGQKVYDIEYPIIGPGGTKRFIHARGEVFQDKDGKSVRMVGTCHNITERRSAEETLRQSQKLESVGQLTGGIAHDFNNLLGVIIGNLDLILDRRKLDAGLKKLVQAALDAALRGGDLTQRLLAFSRKQTLQSKVIYLGERLIQAGTLLRRTLGEQITVKVRAAPDLWPVVADSSQIDNVILNLAINARDAMPKGGAITIDVSNVRFDADYAARNVEVILGDYVLLAVTDTGEGMPPDVLERVFEPFFTTKEVGKGSGLGLSMVYGFVKQSNGHIKIESAVGHGTSVNIYLPRAAAAAAAEAAPENRNVNLSANGEVILVVEDNDSVRAVAVNQLASLGYRTLKAESGEAALALLDKHPEIDLMFSDVVMRGGMNGYELALEACKRRPGLRVLLTSGCEMKSADGLDGVEKFELLKKPYRKRDLAQMLCHLLALN
jgi:PAS domain S-box-containing protein